MTIARSDSERPVDELGAAVGEDELSDQGAQLHPSVASHRLHRPVEPVRDLGDEACFTAPSGAAEAHAVPARIVQVGEHVPEQLTAKDVVLAYWDLRMGVVRETHYLQTRAS